MESMSQMTQAPPNNAPNTSTGWISNQHKQAIEKLKHEGVIKSQKVLEAMLDIDLFHFYRSSAFTDGWDYGHAKNLEAVAPFLKSSNKKVLICNNFSGYFQACVALILGSECRVFSDIGEKGTELLAAEYNELLQTRRIVVLFDANSLASVAPYDLVITFEQKWTDKFNHLVKVRGIIVNPWKPKHVKHRTPTGIVKTRVRN